VTVTLGSVFRAVLTVARTGFIWLFDVALFYSPLGRRRLGEPFDPVASTVQMIGFGLGIIGTLLYAYGSSRCGHGRCKWRLFAYTDTCTPAICMHPSCNYLVSQFCCFCTASRSADVMITLSLSTASLADPEHGRVAAGWCWRKKRCCRRGRRRAATWAAPSCRTCAHAMHAAVAP